MVHLAAVVEAALYVGGLAHARIQTLEAWNGQLDATPRYRMSYALFGVCREGIAPEVLMKQCIGGGGSLCRIECKELVDNHHAIVRETITGDQYRRIEEFMVGTHASILPKTFCNVFGRDLNVLTPSRPGRFSKSGQVSTVGVPHNDQIFSSWSKSVLPGRIGFRVNISAKIQLEERSKQPNWWQELCIELTQHPRYQSRRHNTVRPSAAQEVDTNA